MTPAQRLAAAIRQPKHADRPAVMPYLVAGFPHREGWSNTLLAVSDLADAIEVGVPFSDPMADGPVIQRATRAALEGGVTLRWILDTLASLPRKPGCPLVLMSYANPILQLGLTEAADMAATAGISGFIVPDLPWEESVELRGLLAERGIAAIQLVTPVTSPERLRMLTAGDDGFCYAVTVTGITGAAIDMGRVKAYLDGVRAVSSKPVCAGFGVRTAADVRGLRGHADGAIVGTALVQHMLDGGDPVAMVRDLVSG